MIVGMDAPLPLSIGMAPRLTSMPNARIHASSTWNRSAARLPVPHRSLRELQRRTEFGGQRRGAGGCVDSGRAFMTDYCYLRGRLRT